MGDTAKAVVGIGLIAVGAGALGVGFLAGTSAAVAVGATLGSISATALFAGVGAMVVAGASIVGSAAKVDIGDSLGAGEYAGQVLQTTKTNDAVVPFVYSYVMLGGNTVWESTGNQINADSSTKGYNRDYWSVICLTEHYSGCYRIFSSMKSLSIVSGNDSSINIISAHVSGMENTYTMVNFRRGLTDDDYKLRNMVFPTKDILNGGSHETKTGAELGFPDIQFPSFLESGEGATYLLVHQIFDAEDNANTQLRNVTAEIYGKVVKTIDSENGYSDPANLTRVPKPSEAIADMLIRFLNVDESEIDWESFYEAGNLYGSYSGNRSIHFGLAMAVQSNFQSYLSDILATARMSLARSSGKWVLMIDGKNKESVKTIGAGDLINGSLSIKVRGTDDIANKVTVNHVNAYDFWLKGDSTVESSELKDLDGYEIDKTLDAKAVIYSDQASKLATVTLNSMRYSEDENGDRINQTPLVATFSTTVKHADLEVGDVVTLDSELIGRARKFLILSTETDQSGLINFVTREYCETHYKDSNGSYII